MHLHNRQTLLMERLIFLLLSTQQCFSSQWRHLFFFLSVQCDGLLSFISLLFNLLKWLLRFLASVASSFSLSLCCSPAFFPGVLHNSLLPLSCSVAVEAVGQKREELSKGCESYSSDRNLPLLRISGCFDGCWLYQKGNTASVWRAAAFQVRKRSRKCK